MARPSPPPTSTDRPRRVFSRFYARISERTEAEGMTTLRQELLADLAGDVVEVGAGNGMNFPHYPPAVAQVVAVEPEPYLRALATRAAKTASVAALAELRRVTCPAERSSRAH